MSTAPLRVAVLLYPGAVFFEIALATDTLAAHGVQLWWATPDGSAHAASNGARLAADGGYAEMAARRWDAVVIPGGDPGSIVVPGSANATLHAGHAQGAVMAGICAGALVLAAAGLLRGRRATHTYTPRYASPEAVATTAPYWDGLLYDEADVVVDGPFVTAKPWATVGWTGALMQRLGLWDEAAVGRLAAYHARPCAPPADPRRSSS